MPKDPNNQVFLEFTTIGSVMRVIALHEASGTEVVVQGPAKAGRAELQRLALNKLNYMMAKKSKNAD